MCGDIVAILRPIIVLNRNQVNALDLYSWCICQDFCNSAEQGVFCFVNANNLSGFRTMAEAQAILTKYDIKNTRSEAEYIRAGVFRIGDAIAFFRGKACAFVGIV